ncbi:MAG: mycofactocin-associated electron transfer flavoprotein alpha subunit [Streptosporangiales bacterium]
MSELYSVDRVVAVVPARGGQPAVGADETVAEAEGYAIVAGERAAEAAAALPTARRSWWYETGAGLRPAAVAAALAPLLERVPLVLLPASPDGRDLAPRLAAALDRPLLAYAMRVGYDGGTGSLHAEVVRLDDRLSVPVEVAGPAVVTLVPGCRTAPPVEPLAPPVELSVDTVAATDVEVEEVVDPDPATMDLSESTRVVAGGAGLAPAGTDDSTARATYRLLVDVATALGATAGATRVVTDAGWMDHDRQIGTTGATVHPGLYVAFGISGASQHVGGLGTPRHIVSVNTDTSCPMTSMADLGLVTDARALLVELARRLDVVVPAEVTGD